MKYVAAVFVVFSSLLLACQDTPQNSSGSDSSAQSGSTSDAPAQDSSSGSSSQSQTQTPDTVTRCYVYTKNRDTITMQLSQKGQSVTGKLNYYLFEKDKNTCYISGEMRGDTLVADYTFGSEGTVSVRQEVMLRSGDGFISGSGATKQEGDKTLFTDIKKLSFGSIKLERVSCSN